MRPWLAGNLFNQPSTSKACQVLASLFVNRCDTATTGASSAAKSLHAFARHRPGRSPAEGLPFVYSSNSVSFAKTWASVFCRDQRRLLEKRDLSVHQSPCATLPPDFRASFCGVESLQAWSLKTQLQDLEFETLSVLESVPQLQDEAPLPESRYSEASCVKHTAMGLRVQN